MADMIDKAVEFCFVVISARVYESTVLPREGRIGGIIWNDSGTPSAAVLAGFQRLNSARLGLASIHVFLLSYLFVAKTAINRIVVEGREGNSRSFRTGSERSLRIATDHLGATWLKPYPEPQARTFEWTATRLQSAPLTMTSPTSGSRWIFVCISTLVTPNLFTESVQTK